MKRLPTKIISQEFYLGNTLRTTLEHTGYGGGDSGHGGFVKITFEDLSCTHMELNGVEVHIIEIKFLGDCERDSLLMSLKMIVKELEDNKRIIGYNYE